MLSRRVILAAGLLAPASLRAEQYPSRNVALIAPFAPGASADGIARIVGEQLAARLGKPVIVDNRPGAGGTTGLIALSRSAPDGYTLGVGATGALVVNPHVPGTSSAFDPLRELTPIAKLIDIPVVLVAHPGTGVSSIKDVIERSKASVTGLSFGSTGVNSAQHLAVELLKRATGANLVHVVYRGSAPAVTDVLGGQIQLASVDLTSADPHIRSGGLKALGVMSAKRVVFAPDIPTIAESAVPGFEVSAWIGLFGPAGLPVELARRLSEEVRTILSDAATRQRIEQLACVPDYADAETFARYLAVQSAKMRDVVRSGS